MTEPIVTIAHIERKAIDAYKRGEPIEANPFPWNSAAHRTWNEVYARLENDDRREVA